MIENEERTVYCTCGFREAWPQIKDLVQQNWNEVDGRAEALDLNVVESFYERLEDQDMHFVVIAYDDEETPIGYSSMFVMISPHTGTLAGTNDVLYIAPEHRGKEYGIDLIELSEIEATSRGVEYISFTFKSGAPHEALTSRLGFEQSEVVYNKVIGKQ